MAERTIDLSNYKSGITYGSGNATDDIPGGGSAPADTITYGSDAAAFNPKGTSNGGYVYLQNSKNITSYGVGTLTTGVIRLFKWTGADWE